MNHLIMMFMMLMQLAGTKWEVCIDDGNTGDSQTQKSLKNLQNCTITCVHANGSCNKDICNGNYLGCSDNKCHTLSALHISLNDTCSKPESNNVESCSGNTNNNHSGINGNTTTCTCNQCTQCTDSIKTGSVLAIILLTVLLLVAITGWLGTFSWQQLTIKSLQKL